MKNILKMESSEGPISFHTGLLQVDKTVSLKLVSMVDPGSVSFMGNLGNILPKGKARISVEKDTIDISWNDSVFLSLTYNTIGEGHRYDIKWEVQGNSVSKLKDVISLENAHWYGAAQIRKQHWPIEKWNRGLAPYICGNSFANDYGGVQERYWLSSRGVAIFVNKNVPLFVSLNNNGDKELTLVSKWSSPYNNINGESLQLTYSIYQGRDVQHTHMLLVGNAFPKPLGIPDESLFRYPIWSTWARYKKDINQEVVINFAEEIGKHQFPAAQIEIDDDWTPAYGDHDFDVRKFPDPKTMIDRLRELGYRTTLWVHPFASPFSKASEKSNFWVRTGPFPGYTKWWNGIAKILDVTNPDAVDWFKESLEDLRHKYGITSFKFDAGEANWLPVMSQFKKKLMSPNEYTAMYVKMCVELDQDIRCQEVRVGYQTQQYPVFVRMMDKDSRWDYENGLKTLIPHALTFSLIGFPFILPDMIGGNSYNSNQPEKELFIRWLQATVFLPSLQFSITPWQYDQEVIEISHKMVSLHEEYADEIIKLAYECVKSGRPIIRPLWWIAPNDEEALKIDSEFLVGTNIIVAPVLDKGATNRDIYLPEGMWKDMINHQVVEGRKWYRGFPAKLEDLPFFVKIEDEIEKKDEPVQEENTEKSESNETEKD